MTAYEFQLRYHKACEKAIQAWIDQNKIDNLHPEDYFVISEIEAHPDTIDQMITVFSWRLTWSDIALIDNPKLDSTSMLFGVKRHAGVGNSTRNGIPLPWTFI